MQWFGVAAIAIVAGIASAFFALNEYASGTGAIVKSANANAGRFEAVFSDLVQARYRALNLAAETMLQSRVTVEAFAHDDRAVLVARIEPFYENLHKNFGVEQFNFWTPPAKIYYRAGKPDEIGTDLSSFRKSIVAANERRVKISAVETGLGGTVALRAITPVIVDGKMIGVIEFVSSFDIPLERAEATSGLKWAVSLQKDVSERVERPADAKNDGWQGDDVYFRYSDPATGEAVRAIRFDPRAKDYTLAKANGHTYFVKTFPVTNFSGQATITIAMLSDVTAGFAGILTTVAVKTAILFLILAVGGSVGFVKFGAIKKSLGGVVAKQKAELEERAAFCDAAVAKLKEVDLIKRGFFTNLVIALNEPLQAVAGQLKAIVPTVAALAPETGVAERMQFAVSETTRLSRLIEDYQQIELFRQSLVKSDSPAVSLAAIARTVDEDIAVYRRLPQFAVTVAVPGDLPATRADADLLRRAFAGLIAWAGQRSGQGKVIVSGAVDEHKWLTMSFTGSAFTGAAQPNEALLDESRQFLSRLAAGEASSAAGAPLIGVVLARIIVEFYGGSLDLSSRADAPGFVVRLPAATA